MSKKIFPDTEMVNTSIADHNGAIDAHPDIRGLISSQGNQLDTLSEMVIWKGTDFKTESALLSEYQDFSTTYFRASVGWAGLAGAIVKTVKFNNNVGKQTIFWTNGNPVKFRLGTLGAWGEWQTVATTEKTEILSVLVNGWAGTLIYGKNDLGLVYLDCNVIRDTATSHGMVITTLPVGYRPKKYVVFACKQAILGDNIFLAISTSGAVYISDSTSVTNLVINTALQGQVTFQI